MRGMMSVLGLAWIAMGGWAGLAAGVAEPAVDYTSRVPRSSFGGTLAEQEAQLKGDAQMARFARSRREKAADPHRPHYHFVSPEGTMNDPNGLCFWQGRWHLFYQGYPPEDPRQHWGHAVSDDLVHWRDLPYAIYPKPEEKCFSGATLVERDRVIAMYHGTKVGNMLALSHDPLLLNWEKVGDAPVIPMPAPGEAPPPYRVFDPCIWKKGDHYYSLSGGTQPTGSGGKSVAADFLFRSRDLRVWEYLHPFVEGDRFTMVGDDGACPYFWPLGERHILLFFSHMSGGQYLLGDYDRARDRLVATAHGKFNHGAVGPGGVHAPSATPDGRGGLIAIFNMNPAKATVGWNQIMTLPRRLTSVGRDELGIEPAGALESLRRDHRAVASRRLRANEEIVLDDICGSAMELGAEIDPGAASVVELNVLRSPGGEEQTRIALYRERGYRSRGVTPESVASVVTLDNARSSSAAGVRARPAESAQVKLAADEPFRLRVFIDRSAVEVFVNGRQCVAARVYPGRPDSVGVSLVARGGDAMLRALDAWQMANIYDGTSVAGADRERAAREEIVLADFEGADYGDWTVAGTAFGRGPARGSIGGQMRVTGFEGKGLVNSFFEGDTSVGTLTSPEFKIERRYLTFLIGGGGWVGETCMNLLVDGEVARSAAGPNVRPGGSEALAPGAWEVSELEGKRARLQIVDKAKGGWGHINVDRIAQSDRRPPVLVAGASREFAIDRRYLHLPIKDGGPKRKVDLFVDGRPEVTLDVELADGAPDWWAFLDAGAWKGKSVVLRVDKLPEDSGALEQIEASDEIRGAGELYREPLRPGLHFSSRRGWNNDPNGLVFYRGEYHMFYQHNPYGWGWGNMHWGHAVSRDLVCWTELGDALAPDRLGPMFSGSAVVDWKNSSGLGTGEQPPQILCYTAAGDPAVQCIASSVDGRTYRKYEGNPVVKQIAPGNRDPKVIWHEPTGRWVMALYVGTPDPAKKDARGKPARRDAIHFLGSRDLKQWEPLSEVEGYFECPDLFELAIDGDATRKRWIVTGASSEYAVGRFDGERFVAETGKLRGHRGRGFYAAQTFSDIPASDGRRIQIGWLQAPSPGMPFNQAMSLPLELRLIETGEGPRLAWAPAGELEKLRVRPHRVGGRELKEGDANPFAGVSEELMEVRAEFEPAAGATVKFAVRGIDICWEDVKGGELVVNGHRAPAPLRGGRQRIVLYADRTAYEVFASDGLCYVPMPVIPKAKDRGLTVSVKGGAVRFGALEAYGLRSIWEMR